jgi:diguanylate cyclase (GGDEF)-like protein
MKLTKRVFIDLAIYMVALGVVTGVFFAIFGLLVGLPDEFLTPLFILAYIFVGIFIGIVNTLVTRLIVGTRLQKLSKQMKRVIKHLNTNEDIDYIQYIEESIVEVDTEDFIGESSEAYNELVTKFLQTLSSESSIRKFTEIFTKELDLGKLSEKALSHLIKFTRSTAGMILINRSGTIEVASSHLIKNPKKVINLEIVHKTFNSKERTIFSFSKDITIEAGLIDFQPESILLEPIVYKDECLGIVLLASAGNYPAIIESQLDVYTYGLSLGMYNAITHDKIEQLAILDPLTKMYNRRFGMDRLKEEYARSIRTQTPLAVLMLDIDFFKRVNDKYGHIVGDKVLVEFSQTIKGHLRKSDVFIRYGGEEFLAILPGAPLAGLKILAEKVRKLVESMIIEHEDEKIKITVSMGGISIPEYKVEDAEELIAIADKLLYEAKESGRNKAVTK